MGKKAIIVVHLTKESSKKKNQNLAEEITKELSGDEPKFPWFKEVESITIVER